MSEILVLFKSYISMEESKDIRNQLMKCNIISKVIKRVEIQTTHYDLYILDRDKSKAEQVLSKLKIDIPKEHYLLEFTDLELLDIIKYQEEWSKYDYQIAGKILEIRGIKEHENSETITNDFHLKNNLYTLSIMLLLFSLLLYYTL